MVLKRIFHKCGWKIIKYFAKKSFIAFKRAKYSSFEYKIFFLQNVLLYFFYPHSRKMPLQLFVDFETDPVSSGSW